MENHGLHYRQHDRGCNRTKGGDIVLPDASPGPWMNAGWDGLQVPARGAIVTP